MPRNLSGTYTLPAGNPVTSGSPISTVTHNNTNNDLATALTDSLSRTGNGGMLTPFKNVDGTQSLPGITFVSEPTTGFSRETPGDLVVSALGVPSMMWSDSGLWAWDASLTAWLQMVDPVAGSRLALKNAINIFTQNQAINKATPSFQLQIGGTAILDLTALAGSALISAVGASSLGFYTNGVVRFAIDSAGAGAFAGAMSVTGALTANGGLTANTLGVSGAATLSSTLGVTGQATFTLEPKAPGYKANTVTPTDHGYQFLINNVIRWWLSSNSVAESGSNVGSDFVLYRYSDAGSFLGNAFSITRSTGTVNINGILATNSIANSNSSGGTSFNDLYLQRTSGAGSATVSANTWIQLWNVFDNRGAGMQLTPQGGLGIWGHNGVSWNSCGEFRPDGAFTATYLCAGNAGVYDTYLTRIAAGRMALVGIEIGYRQLPHVTAPATASAVDVGKCYIAGGASLTVPNGFSPGDVFSIYNNSAAAISIVAGVTTLRLAGTATTGTRTLAARGLATVFCLTSSECIISGAGVS